VDQNQIITDSPTGKRVSIQSPKVSVVGSPPLKMDTLSPPSSKAEVRKLWRLSIQSSVDLSSSDDENFDADDEITTTCIGDMTSIPIQKSENVNFSPPTKVWLKPQNSLFLISFCFSRKGSLGKRHSANCRSKMRRRKVPGFLLLCLELSKISIP
jgi:hypothetical protein